MSHYEISTEVPSVIAKTVTEVIGGRKVEKSVFSKKTSFGCRRVGVLDDIEQYDVYLALSVKITVKDLQTMKVVARYSR